MIRTHIQLTKEQSRRVKRVAVRKGVSVAQVIRQFILVTDTAMSIPVRVV
jgi:hypothetical protein